MMNKVSEYIEVNYRGMDFVLYTRLGAKLDDPRSNKWLRISGQQEHIGSRVTPEGSTDPIYTATITNGLYSAAYSCSRSGLGSLDPAKSEYLLKIVEIINYCLTRI